MALKKPNKSIYKVYVKPVDKYYSSGTSKATWNSLSWAMSAASDAKYRHGCKSSDIEIHEFPVTEAIKHNYDDLIEEERARLLEKRQRDSLLKQKQAEELEIKRAKTAIKIAQEALKDSIKFLASKGITLDMENTDKL